SSRCFSSRRTTRSTSGSSAAPAAPGSLPAFTTSLLSTPRVASASSSRAFRAATRSASMRPARGLTRPPPAAPPAAAAARPRTTVDLPGPRVVYEAAAGGDPGREEGTTARHVQRVTRVEVKLAGELAHVAHEQHQVDPDQVGADPLRLSRADRGRLRDPLRL